MECQVCYESFSKEITIPKILTKCGHTICQACLNNYTKASSACKVKCPFCKIEYSVSEIQSSPTNFYILNMLNEKEETTAKQNKKLETRTCSMHSSTQMDFFCKTDRTYLCGKCLLSGDHINHVIVHVDDEANTYKNGLTKSIKSLEERAGRIGDSKERFEGKLQEYQSLTRQVVADLDKKFNEVLNMIVKRREELIESFLNSTASMNEYLKGKVSFLTKLQETFQEHIAESKEIKKNVGTPGFDLRRFTPLEDEKFINEISENLAGEFDLEKRKSKSAFEDMMQQVESVQLDFTQSPFFTFNENSLKDFLEDYAKIASFNFGLNDKLKVENDLFFGSHSAHHDEKNGRKKVKVETSSTAMEEEKTDSVTFDFSEKLFGLKNPLAPKDTNPSKSQLFETIFPSSHGEEGSNTRGSTTTVSLVRDPFAELLPSGTTICLLGQSDKAMYINERGQSEMISLEFEFTNPEEKKGNIFKNFACSVFFDRNKVIYTGGGPSCDVYLLEFKTKKRVVVTALPKMSQRRCWHGSVYVLPHIYVIGGFDGSHRLNHCERLNVTDIQANSTFEQVASMNEARSLFGYTLSKDNMIYVAGGIGMSKNTDTIERYSIIHNKWELLKVRLPQKLCGLSCVYFENEDKIKVFGGSDNLRKSTKSVFELSLQNGKLEEVKPMYKTRQMNNKVFKKNDMLYFVGGNSNSEGEVWNLASKGKDFMFNYGDVMKGDLNNFSGFVI